MAEDEGRLDHETLVTVTLAQNGETTVLNFRQEGSVSAESRDSHEEGWIGVLENLSDHLRAPESSTDIPMEGNGR